MTENWLDIVTRGAPADHALVALLDGMTADLRHTALERYAAERMPTVSPLSDDGIGWRAWVAGWASIADSRPLDGIAVLEQTGVARRLAQDGANRLLDAELGHLCNRLLTLNDAWAPPVVTADRTHEVLLRFLTSSAKNAEDAGGQVLAMVSAFVDSAAGWPDQLSKVPLMSAWAVTRGVDLFTDIARAKLDSGANGPHIIGDLLEDVILLVTCTGTRLEDKQVAKVELAIGDCCQEEEPERALACYRKVLRTLGVVDRLGLQAAVNLALLGDDDTAVRLLPSLRKRVEGPSDAAKLWIMECAARWRLGAGAAIREDLIKAISLFEQNIPRSADYRTMFAHKKDIETGYRLLATINAQSDDRSDERFDEIVSVVWALLSAEHLTHLDAELSGDFWNDLLSRQARPIPTLHTALVRLPGTGILHLVLGLECLVWVIYGFDRKGIFRFHWGTSGEQAIERMRDVYSCMYDQLNADLIGDSLAVDSLSRRLEQLGNDIGESLPHDIHDAFSDMDHLIYAPHPAGNLDEFPITTLRTNGRWLTDQLPVTRATTFTMLLQSLSPNLAATCSNNAAAIILGSAEVDGARLRGTQRHVAVIQGMLTTLGFRVSTADRAGVAEFNGYLDGGCGVLHYVGHGIAGDRLEALPLSAGENFNPLYAENFKGYRLPFTFLCACVAARIRYGAGGHLIGLITGLLDRGAPAGLAFSTPVTEQSAYLIAEQFYREARGHLFGEAVARTISAVRTQVPAYAWLALTAYGDPCFSLSAMADSASSIVPTLRQRTQTWHSAVRSHCALQTNDSQNHVHRHLEEVPDEIRTHITRWLAYAFTSEADPSAITQLEEAAVRGSRLSPAERLTAKCAACSVRLRTFGVDTFVVAGSERFGSSAQVLFDASFIARVGAALVDDQLNGVGLGLLGIAFAMYDKRERAGNYLRQAIAQLWVYEDASPYLSNLLANCRQALLAVGQSGP